MAIDPMMKWGLWRMAEEDTPTQGLPQAGMFGGSPEQAMAMLQDPQTLERLAQFGIHPHPELMRQSPFFGNQFMGQHPGLGGFLNRAMANVAMTPSPQGPEGFGGGMSRFAQGAAGGPEMLRQFQMRQIMAPFQQLGMQMPMMGEMRRQHMLDMIREDLMGRREQEGQQADWRQQMAAFRQQHEQAQAENQMLRTLLMGMQQGLVYNPPEPAGQTPMGPMTGLGALPGIMAPTGPARPAQPGYFEQDPELIRQRAEAKETPAQKAEREGKAEQARRGPGVKDQSKWSAQYDVVEKQYADTRQRIQAALVAGQIDQQKAAQMMAEADATRETSKANIDKARGDPGASTRGWQQGAPPAGTVSPGAQLQSPPQQQRPSGWF